MMNTSYKDHHNNQEISDANRDWWDSDAQRYHNDHAAYLNGFHWCPEMLAESEAHLLGDISGLNVLEIGCGSAPCSRWLSNNYDAFVTGFDLSMGMLRHCPLNVPLAQANAMNLPYKDNSFDVVFSAFGAFPFIENLGPVLEDIARCLKPRGRFVFSTNHPMRWIFPDDPTEAGLCAELSYFDRSYIERDKNGKITYAEFHRTMGDWIELLNASGFMLDRLIEPEWPTNLTETWGQWSPLRGRIFPGTAIFVTHCR
ncbi:class I SAM-dependent methyltransferase [Corynebacterium rouxii]|uniref:Class I SAM-dependent methyltransferase n=1 Tax=Corynebacterium rouxii TaxID=2719119 RepID=A0A6I8MHC9_9CORY|nr:class I SAM-dependent methyltransferase [Corynebacterium rouxii]VZH85137.1 class I SAM-dependent methyltransferase [Corynebacterium rouxii]